CIQACPVDAILGAAKHMHTVISDECTGCQLCLPPCPVECIDMTPVKIDTGNWCWPFPKPTGELPVGNTSPVGNPSMVGS
ncbi:MAG: RnfABCDGE type electron transport complex subunit B, partial [Candidatus Sedimenticola sp. (ex Thyasira tokunagai)]